MNMASTKFEAGAVGAWGGERAVRIGRAVWAAITRWYARRMAVRYLQTVDDRILKDIGISRGEILSAMYGDPRRAGYRHDRY